MNNQISDVLDTVRKILVEVAESSVGDNWVTRSLSGDNKSSLTDVCQEAAALCHAAQQTLDRARDLATRLAAAERTALEREGQVAALRERLIQRDCQDKHDPSWSFDRCTLCGSKWSIDALEVHEGDCPVAADAGAALFAELEQLRKPGRRAAAGFPRDTEPT